jgi:signal transduction histidine kinase
MIEPRQAGSKPVPGNLLASLVLSLIAAALLPLIAFGGLTLLLVEAATTTSLHNQVRVALDAASGLLEQDRRDLEETTVSYATWPELQAAVAAGDLTGLEVDVVDFQIDLGRLDAVAIASVAAVVAGGDAAARAELEAIARQAAQAEPSAVDVGPHQLGLESGVYQVAAVPVVLDGRTIGSVVMARRIGPSILVAMARTTGFDAVVELPGGGALVATDAALAQQISSRSPAGPGPQVSIGEGLAVGSLALSDAAGQTVATMSVVKPLDALDAITTSLVALVALTLLLASLGSFILAWALGVRLRRRAEAVAGWLDAVGAGMAPPTGSRTDLDIEPVSRAVGDLATVLQRREARLRASLDEIARLTPHLGSRAVAEAGMGAAKRVFEADDVALEVESERHGALPESDGERPGDLDGGLGTGVDPFVAASIEVPWRDLVTSAATGPDSPRPAAAGAGQDGDSRSATLVARGAALAGWEEPDRAIFALYARLLGIAIRDAQLVDQAAHRAGEMSRLAALQADFLRGVSHNLQQPLTTIRLAADDLDDGADPGRASVAAGTIRAESVRLARLVHRLLTMSRLDAGTMRVEVEPIAPAALVRNVWATLRSHRRLIVDDRAPGVLAIADRALVEQIVSILLDNAVKYAQRGPITVRIEPRRVEGAVGDDAAPPAGREPAWFLAITVIDTGPGVPAAERERIFERFARGSTSEGIDGTGLGLDVARRLARAMGGEVACLASPGGGGAFELLLPAEAATGPA